MTKEILVYCFSYFTASHHSLTATRDRFTSFPLPYQPLFVNVGSKVSLLHADGKEDEAHANLRAPSEVAS
ncbi:MAG: hypothetical protein WAT12_08750 [Candidatus Nitrotoga sp.]